MLAIQHEFINQSLALPKGVAPVSVEQMDSSIKHLDLSIQSMDFTSKTWGLISGFHQDFSISRNKKKNRPATPGNSAVPPGASFRMVTKDEVSHTSPGPNCRGVAPRFWGRFWVGLESHGAMAPGSCLEKTRNRQGLGFIHHRGTWKKPVDTVDCFKPKHPTTSRPPFRWEIKVMGLTTSIENLSRVFFIYPNLSIPPLNLFGCC